MIKVTIFNEFSHEKWDENVKSIYPEGIHMTLKKYLSKDEELSIRTVTLDDEECGLSDEVLKDSDVLIWWGHIRHNDVSDEVAYKVVKAVNEGMGIIFLHSAHHSKPFRYLMGTPCSLSWREDGDKEYLWVVDPSHPIAKGIDRYIFLQHEETYSEPFSIPTPDEIVFIGNFEGGEVLRAGCCYKRGYGKVFYFQPGHETLPIYHNKDIIKVIDNAIHWAKSDFKKQIDCPNIKKISN